ncbi:hypothetical protein GWI33_013107 [Rhynchophorus ferrugineus]|uniref:Uncharacterized protein n=1 Tax=Rhynchophorus ferrugineus TaxID=354439 RepID=A0A834MDJ2_RHYFE|nr:hypothetical protein GWI33_013107 [Rhynchophorus ferrugineus]
MERTTVRLKPPGPGHPLAPLDTHHQSTNNPAHRVTSHGAGLWTSLCQHPAPRGSAVCECCDGDGPKKGRQLLTGRARRADRLTVDEVERRSREKEGTGGPTTRPEQAGITLGLIW